jgi:hypothetical protein
MFSQITRHWYLSLLLLTQCAQVVPPTGGPKDTTAPELLQTFPENKSLNFKGKSIQLIFDEYVVIDNIQQKLIITPEVENPFTFKLNDKTVTLNFKNAFPESTTFTLNFGDAIKDFAEKLPAKNLKLVFSTGPSIDSAKISGTVTDLLTDKPVFDALVGLYKPADTLNPEKQKPYYFSRTDSSGRYQIENVQASHYSLIALDDKNRNLLYNSKEERIAFFNESTNVTSFDTTQHALKLFISDLTVPRVQRTSPKVNTYSVVFNKNMDSIHVHFPADSLPYFLEQPNTLKFFHTPAISDTVHAIITGVDSLGLSFEVEQKIAFLPKRGKERRPDPFTLRTTPDKNEGINREFTYLLTFNKPIKLFDPEKISFVKDSTTKRPLADFKWQWDQYKTEVTIFGNSNAKDSLKLDIANAAIISIEDDTVAAQVIKHKFLSEEDYGIIRGKVDADSSVNYILELVDSQLKVVQRAYKSPYVFTKIRPGDYQIRLILDRNNNKRWDTGNYHEKAQPEHVLFFPGKITVKSNFEYDDNNFTIPRE